MWSEVMINENEWDVNYINNLKEMDKKIKESTVTLNYDFITEKYFEMYEVALNAGTIMPYRFNLIGPAYRGNQQPKRLNNFDPNVKKRLEQSYAKRNELQKQYTNSDSDPVGRYKNFLDKEIYDFIEEFPQYKDIILNDD